MLLTFNSADAFQQAFDQQLAEAPDGATWQTAGRPSREWPRGEDEVWWRVNGPKMVQRWIEWRDVTPWDTWVAPDGALGIELAMLVNLDGEPVKLFIDNIFSTAPDNSRPVILDKKSGARTPKGDLQLGLYKVAVEATWPQIKIAGGCYWMARTGASTPIQSLDMYTPKLIGTYMRRIRLARAAGIFNPNVSDFCKSCGVGKYCAINRGAEAHLDPDYALMGGHG